MYRNKLLVTLSSRKVRNDVVYLLVCGGDHSSGCFNMKSMSLNHHAHYLVLDRGKNILNEMG